MCVLRVFVSFLRLRYCVRQQDHWKAHTRVQAAASERERERSDAVLLKIRLDSTYLWA